MADGVIVGEKSYPLLHPITKHPIPIFNWRDHGMEFHPGDGYNNRRAAEINLGVFHWTGSENALETMFSVLKKRKLGIEFAISPYGSLYQFCDPMEVDTADAGIVNSRSWGVEMVNAGFRRPSTLWREPRYRKVQMGPRTPYDTVIHGKKIRCWNFYPAQTLTAFALNEVMVQAVPTYPATVHPYPDGVISNINAKTTVDGVIEYAIQGAVGHYQISEKKFDPGTQFMLDLSDYMDHGTIPEYLRAA